MNQSAAVIPMAPAINPLRIAGVDPSLRNVGIARAQYDVLNQRVSYTDLQLVQTSGRKHKQVRQNSADLDAAEALYRGVAEALADAHVIFVEIPVGSQSSRAMASYGICVGVFGALRANGVNFIQIPPSAVKQALASSLTASKATMIDRAMQAHPELNWPMRGEMPVLTKAEHLADAIGTIKAGVSTTEFHQLVQILAQR